MQEATGRVADRHPEWPRFRVGINSGPATVSVLGTEGGRTHTVIGDTVNTASRIEGKAPAGGVAIGPSTLADLPGAVTSPLGALDAQGQGGAGRDVPPAGAADELRSCTDPVLVSTTTRRCSRAGSGSTS